MIKCIRFYAITSVIWLMSSISVFATDIQYPTITMPDIIVSAKRFSQPINQVIQNVTVITAADIAQSPATTVPELLENISGVIIENSGGRGRAASAQIHGLNDHQVLVLMDGIEYNDLSSGVANLSEIPLDIVERVEIVKGTASSVWGSSLGGVIHIITKSCNDTKPSQVLMSMGGYASTEYGVQYQDNNKVIPFLFSGNWQSTGGFRDKSALAARRFFSKWQLFQRSPVNASLVLGYQSTTSEEFDNPTYLFWRGREYHTLYGKFNVAYLYNNDITLNSNIYYRQAEIQSDTYSSTSNLQLVDPTISDDLLKKVGVQAIWEVTPQSTWTSGMDFNTVSLVSTYLTEKKIVDTTSAFSNLAFPTRIGQAEVGVRYDDYISNYSQLSPSLGLMTPIRLGNMLVLWRNHVEYGFHNPPLLWKYLEGGRYVSNPDLTSEKAWLVQSGVESDITEWIWIKCQGYYSYISDAIDRAYTLDGKEYMANYKAYRHQGIEVDTKWFFNKPSYIRMSTAFNDIRNEDTQEVVKGRPRLSHNIGIVLQPEGRPFTINFQGNFVWWNEDPKFQPNDKKWIWNLKYSQPLSSHHQSIFYISIYNLLNESYWHYADYPQPLRYAELGLRYYWE